MMKFCNVFFPLLILLSGFETGFGQEAPKAILVDKFDAMTCKIAMAKLDAFYTDLAKNPNSTGYIVIYPDKTSIKKGFAYERWIKNYIVFKKYDAKRVVTLRGSKSAAPRIELWNVTFGADQSFYVEEKWTPAFPEVNKAFVFVSFYADTICPSFNLRDYADFLLSDTNLRGHLVVFNKSPRESQREAQNWLAALTKDYKIPRNRLRVFFAKNISAPEIEFWIVPRRKK